MGILPATVDPASRASSPVSAASRESGPVGLGLVPLGIAFGVFVTHSGLAWWWATVFTTVIYAGSFEFLLVGLVTALAPLATIAVTAFLVNVRHVFYALSFPMHRVRGSAARAYSTFALTDEAYALTTADPSRSWSSSRILWLQVFLHLYWVGGLIELGVCGHGFGLGGCALARPHRREQAGSPRPSQPRRPAENETAISRSVRGSGSARGCGRSGAVHTDNGAAGGGQGQLPSSLVVPTR